MDDDFFSAAMQKIKKLQEKKDKSVIGLYIALCCVRFGYHSSGVKTEDSNFLKIIVFTIKN